ncbi:MAG: hypothetical protein ACK4I8_05020, partial [Armatimonadota bacterium]
VGQKPSVPRWIWWMFGCTLVAGFILLCSCGIGGFFAYQLVQRELPPPVTLADIKKAIPDLPIYPRAKFDEWRTNLILNRSLQRALMVSDTVLILYFETTDPFKKVKDWYHRQLLSLGWEYFEGYFYRGGETLEVRRDPYGNFGFALFYSSCVLPDWFVNRLEERVKRNPNDFEAWAFLAYGYFCLGRWKESQKALQRAMQKPLRSKDAQLRLARLLLWIGSDKKVLPIVRAFGRDDAGWRFDEARLLLKLGRCKEAEQVLTSALASAAFSKKWKDWFHVLRGIARWKQNKLQQALSDFEQAYQIDTSWWRLTAWANWKLGKRERAREIVQTAAQEGYSDAESILKRGKKAVWLGIVAASAPSWLTKRWFEGAKVKGKWAVEVIFVPESQNEALLKEGVVFAINGQLFGSEGEFWRHLDSLSERARYGETVNFSVWRRGKVEQVTVKFEPFFK